VMIRRDFFKGLLASIAVLWPFKRATATRRPEVRRIVDPIQFGDGSPVVSMILWHDVALVATEYAVYQIRDRDGELESSVIELKPFDQKSQKESQP